VSALLGLYWVGSSGTHDCRLKQGKEISQVGVALGNQQYELNKMVDYKLVAEKILLRLCLLRGVTLQWK